MSTENPNPETENTETQETPAAEAEQNDLSAEVERLKSEYLYLKAEFDTHKRNAIKERSDLLKYGAERMLMDILGVLDIFEQALASEVTPDSFQSFVQGIEMTSTELKKALEKSGVEEINPVGQPFDPTFHEALTSEESNEVEAGHVLRVFKKGYKLHEKVIRAAQVVVAK